MYLCILLGLINLFLGIVFFENTALDFLLILSGIIWLILARVSYLDQLKIKGKSK